MPYACNRIKCSLFPISSKLSIFYPMPPRPSHRASSVRDLIDRDVPFPGGYEDRITIELPMIRNFEEDTGREWTDICLSLRGGGEMAVVSTILFLTFSIMSRHLYSIPRLSYLPSSRNFRPFLPTSGHISGQRRRRGCSLSS